MVFEIFTALLLTFLVIKELLAVASSARMRRLGELMYLPIIPLLGLFIVEAFLKVVELPPWG